MSIEESYDNEEGPTNWDFDDWKESARQYALTNFPDWHSGMVTRYARDIAWRYEGISITPEALESAYEDWISGSSPYSPHAVGLDGYDYDIWQKKQNRKAIEELVPLATGAGFDERSAERYANDTYKWTGVDSRDFDTEEFIESLGDWLSGKNPHSPHHIRHEPENIAERRERLEELNNRYQHKADFIIMLADPKNPYSKMVTTREVEEFIKAVEKLNTEKSTEQIDSLRKILL